MQSVRYGRHQFLCLKSFPEKQTRELLDKIEATTKTTRTPNSQNINASQRLGHDCISTKNT